MAAEGSGCRPQFDALAKVLAAIRLSHPGFSRQPGRLLESTGIEAVSLREAARLANVSPNAPYCHFPDRAALQAALAEHTRGETVRAAASSRVGRLGAMGVASVRFALDFPNPFRLILSEIVRHDDHPALAGVGKRTYTILVEHIPNNPVGAKALIHGGAHLLLEGPIASAGSDPSAIEILVRHILSNCGGVMIHSRPCGAET